MKAKDTEIVTLQDLNSLRTAPTLSERQSKKLYKELKKIISKTDWLTVGIMAPSIKKGIDSIREIEEVFRLKEMKCITMPKGNGPIYLKANQKSGEIHARVEYGLGEGILISCHSFDNTDTAITVGPLPINFFANKK